MFKILTVFLVILYQSSGVIINASNDNEELIAVVVAYRHGARSPLESYPNDKYFNLRNWPMGFGQLTKFGVMSQYNLGQWFRQRYKSFLKEIYSEEEMYVISTDTDRTLMSAYANLAGLYPPKDFQLWSDQIPWQPIPVHTNDRAKDDIIVEKRECSNYNSIYEKAKQETYDLLNLESADFLENIQKNSGWPNVTIEEAKTLRSIWNSFSSYNNSFIPEWSETVDQDTLDYLAASYIHVCHPNREDVSECIKENLKILRPKFKYGIPELLIPQVNPFRVTSAQAKLGNTAKGSLNDIQLWVKDFIVEDFKVDLDDFTLKIKVTFPEVRGQADYRVSGKIMVFNLDGHGLGKLNLYNLTANIKAEGVRQTREGKEYIVPTSITIKPELDKMDIHLENLFPNNLELTNQVNQLLNDNQKVIFEEFSPFVVEIIKGMIFNYINALFSTYSFDVLFPYD